MTGEFRYWEIVLKKSFLADERKVLGPLMRFGRRDVRDIHPKSTTDLRSGAEERCSGREV
jgi:hypothetical protein